MLAYAWTCKGTGNTGDASPASSLRMTVIEFLSFNFKNEKEPWLRSSIWMKEGREFILSCSFSKSSVSVEIERDRSKHNGRFSPNGSVHHVLDVLQFYGFRYRELCLVHSGDVMIFLNCQPSF